MADLKVGIHSDSSSADRILSGCGNGFLEISTSASMSEVG